MPKQITLELSDKVEERWNDVQVRSGAIDYADMLTKAVGVYNVLLKANEDRRRVFIEGHGKREQLVIE